MSTFALIPGAGGAAWYWHRVVPLLEDAGHKAVAVDLPAADDDAGLEDYADVVVKAIGKRKVVVVAQSLGGFTAALVCERVRVEALVFVNAMIPKPGETAGAWWGNTSSEKARVAAAKRGGYPVKYDDYTYFLHDVPKKVIKESEAHPHEQSSGMMKDPCTFKAWPRVPITAIAGRDDRFFPIDFQRRVARERLGVDIDEIRGGHLVSLSNPKGLAKKLVVS